jgi:hypothetical protein
MSQLDKEQEKLEATMISLNQCKLELEGKQKILKELDKQEKTLQGSIESLKQLKSDAEVALSTSAEKNKAYYDTQAQEKAKLSAELEAIREMIDQEGKKLIEAKDFAEKEIKKLPAQYLKLENELRAVIESLKLEISDYQSQIEMAKKESE